VDSNLAELARVVENALLV
jgi:hypothetical protein